MAGRLRHNTGKMQSSVTGDRMNLRIWAMAAVAVLFGSVAHGQGRELVGTAVQKCSNRSGLCPEQNDRLAKYPARQRLAVQFR